MGFLAQGGNGWLDTVAIAQLPQPAIRTTSGMHLHHLLPAILLPVTILLLAACGDDQPATPAAQPLLDAAQLEALARDPTVTATGKRLFETGKGFCTTCHGVGGVGTGQGVALSSGRWKHGGSLADIQRAISDGIPGTAMAPWGRSFTPDELAALAIYVRSLAPSSAPAGAAP
jgi:mono/diheme cytochrome c family protein